MDALKQWMGQYGIYAKTFGREFSNAVLVARLLKKLYPKLVDLHNYPPISNTPQKLNNWSTLNYKVLSKIGLTLPADIIWQLAHGNTEFVTWLLSAIMQKTFYCENPNSNYYTHYNNPVYTNLLHESEIKPINELDLANKMYRKMLENVQNKIKELEGSLHTIDEVYKQSVQKCIYTVSQQSAHESTLKKPLHGKKSSILKKRKTKKTKNVYLNLNKVDLCE